MILHGGKYNRRVGSALVILRQIQPQDPSLSIYQERCRHRKCHRLMGQGCRVKAGISQAKSVSHCELHIGQHARLKTVEVPLSGNILGRVGTDRHDLYTAPVKLCAKFLEST